MSRRLVVSCVAAALALGALGPAEAAREWFGGAARKPATSDVASGLELLVFEVEGCATCSAFKRDVAPLYRQGPNAAVAPLRFVDINRVDTDKLALNGDLRIVPTVVLMKDGREVDRVVGYFAPDVFLRMVTHLIGKAE